MTKIKLGTKVSVTAKYSRVYEENSRKTYKEKQFFSQGIFIGYRTLSNGYVHYEYDEGAYWVPQEHFQVGLFVHDLNINPIYIPLTAIKEIPDD